MEHIDTAVIGAGVVGLSSALAIARRGHSVCVLEREPRAGMGTSTHNSQVIHAGMYYPPGSLKARHCVAGARLLYDFCERYQVPYRRCGKLVVAADDHEIADLEKIKARGDANGVEGLEIVDRGFINGREPHVHGVAALYSPNTGILEAEALVKTLARLSVEHDAVVLPGTPLVGAEVSPTALTLRTPSETIAARSVVNAAGLFADGISAMFEGRDFQVYPCRGEYAELVPARRSMVNALVYPLPHRHGLGVHLAKTIHGNVTLGPTAAFQDRKDDYESERLPIEAFLEPARRLLPALTLEDLRLGGTGIRAKIHPATESYADFFIARDDKCPRLVQAAGIESPGLTSCLSIAEHVADLVEEVLA